MPVEMSFCKSEISKQQILCCLFCSIAGLAWGTFLLILCLTYRNSFIWKEICLFLASVVIAVSFISLLVNLVGLIWKEMCCCQKNFMDCNIERDTTPEEQHEPANESLINIANSNCNEIPLRHEQANSVIVAKTHSDISTPLSSTPTQLQHQREVNLQCEPIYMLPFEDNCIELPRTSKTNGRKVRATRSLTPQREMRCYYAPRLSSVCFEESPVKNSLSQDVKTTACLQREAHKRHSGVCNTLFMQAEESFNQCNEMPIYQNVPSSNIKCHPTIPKEFAASRKSSLRNFQVKAITENTSKGITIFSKSSSCNLNLKAIADTPPKDVTAFRKFSPRHFNVKAITEKTSPKDVTALGISSPRCFNMECMVESTIPKVLAVSDKSSSRYVDMKTEVKNRIPEDLEVSGACSSRYVNIIPTTKSIISEDLDESDAHSLMGILI